MRKPAYNALEIARSVVVAILERSGIDLINCRDLPPLTDHYRFAVERRGHLWKSRGEVLQILGNGCSDGKFQEPAVNQKSKKQSATRNRVRHAAEQEHMAVRGRLHDGLGAVLLPAPGRLSMMN